MPVAKLKCKCHREYQPRESLIVTPKGKFCSYELMIEWANKQTSKRIQREKRKAKQSQAKKDKAFKRETIERRNAIKKRTGKNGYYDNLKTQLHRYIKHVLRKDEPCYTCDKPQSPSDSGQAFHVGHFIPQKQVDPRRFMLINLRMQCYKCNTHNSGMRAEYRQRLIEEIGIDKVDWLECDTNHKELKEQYPEISDIKTETARYRGLSKES